MRSCNNDAPEHNRDICGLGANVPPSTVIPRVAASSIHARVAGATKSRYSYTRRLAPTAGTYVYSNPITNGEYKLNNIGVYSRRQTRSLLKRATDVTYRPTTHVKCRTLALSSGWRYPFLRDRGRFKVSVHLSSLWPEVMLSGGAAVRFWTLWAVRVR